MATSSEGPEVPPSVQISESPCGPINQPRTVRVVVVVVVVAVVVVVVVVLVVVVGDLVVYYLSSST